MGGLGSSLGVWLHGGCLGCENALITVPECEHLPAAQLAPSCHHCPADLALASLTLGRTLSPEHPQPPIGADPSLTGFVVKSLQFQ